MPRPIYQPLIIEDGSYHFISEGAGMRGDLAPAPPWGDEHVDRCS